MMPVRKMRFSETNYILCLSGYISKLANTTPSPTATYELLLGAFFPEIARITRLLSPPPFLLLARPAALYSCLPNKRPGKIIFFRKNFGQDSLIKDRTFINFGVYSIGGR